MKIFEPVVEHLHLQIRFNLGSRNVEIKVSLA
jgi:RNA-binding protein PNO1